MKTNKALLFFFIILLFILLVEISVAKHLISTFVFARPSQIATRFWEMLLSENLLSHLVQTTLLSIISALLGFLIGVLIAFVMISLGETQKYAEFLLDFVRSIPLTTLVPIFIAIYGIGNSPKIAIGSVSSALTTALAVYLGLKAVKESRRDFLYLYQPNLKNRIFKLYRHEAKSSLFTALRLSLSIALVLIIVSEMFIGTEKGIGKLIIDKTYTDDRAGQYAVILITGLIGWSLNKLTFFLQPNN